MGVLQGITEWLPISSSGQVMLALMNLFGLDAGEAFSLSLYLHLGTLAAVITRLRYDVYRVIISLPKFRTDPLVQFLTISTIFTAIIGIPIYKILKENFASYQGDFVTALIGFFLILTGIILYLSSNSKILKGKKETKDIKLKDMVLLGIAQGFTILPGISRSGITVAALLFRNFDSETALKLSFLMSIPAILCGVGLELGSAAAPYETQLSYIIIGITFAFASGYAVIDLLLRFAKKVKFHIFCIGFGLIASGTYLFFYFLF